MAVRYMRPADWPDPATDPNTTSWSFHADSIRTFPSLGTVQIVRKTYDTPPPPAVTIWAVLGPFGAAYYEVAEGEVVTASGSISLVGTPGAPNHWLELQFLNSSFAVIPSGTVLSEAVLSGPVSIEGTAPAGSAYVLFYIKQEWTAGADFAEGFQIQFADIESAFAITSGGGWGAGQIRMGTN